MCFQKILSLIYCNTLSTHRTTKNRMNNCEDIDVTINRSENSLHTQVEANLSDDFFSDRCSIYSCASNVAENE